MSQYIVNFTETFIVSGASEQDAITTAKDLFTIRIESGEMDLDFMAIDCEILPSILTTKETR